MAEITVCMIVRNEQARLRRCLDSLRGLYEELVIADTGSSDGTKEIAREYTPLVYDFLWTGDFSQARNFVFSKATREYIYSADADEVLDEENRRRFALLKNALLPEVEIVQMKYLNQLENGSVYNFDCEYRPKLFRRLRTFRWISPIHETVVTEPVVFDSDVEILHLPAERHAARDLEALRRAAQAAPLPPRLHHMYATELYLAGEPADFFAARESFAATLLDPGRTMEEVQDALCVLAREARLRGDGDAFMRYALKSVIGVPAAEVCCELGEYYLARGEYGAAAEWFDTAAHGAESCVSLAASGAGALERLSECYEAMGETDAAAEIRREALACEK